MKPRRFKEKPLGVKTRHAGAPSMIEPFDMFPTSISRGGYNDAYSGGLEKQSEANDISRPHALAMTRLPFWARTGAPNVSSIGSASRRALFPAKILSFIHKRNVAAPMNKPHSFVLVEICIRV